MAYYLPHSPLDTKKSKHNGENKNDNIEPGGS